VYCIVVYCSNSYNIKVAVAGVGQGGEERRGKEERGKEERRVEAGQGRGEKGCTVEAAHSAQRTHTWAKDLTADGAAVQ
jgi:hypothetical protein